MSITRNNYEQFFLDFSEGRLDSALRAEFERFLDTNPDLKKELEAYESIALSPASEVNFRAKSSLKKTFIPVDEINETNYENFLVGELENELNDEEKKNLKSFVSKNNFIEAERKLFHKTILFPDTKILFPNKSQLKKTAVIQVNWRQAAAVFAIAASVLLLLYVYFGKENISSPVKNQIVHKKQENENNLQSAVNNQQERKENKIVVAENNVAYAKEKVRRTKRNEKNRQPFNIPEQKETPQAINNFQNKNTNKETIAEIQSSEEKVQEEKLTENKLEEKNITEESAATNTIPESPEKNENKIAPGKNEGFTLKEFLAFAFKKNVLKEDVPKQKKEAKITPLDLASAATKGAAKIFGSKIKMKKRYNENGELAAVSVSSRKFEFSRTLHKK